MDLIWAITSFGLNALLTGVCLWLASKVTFEYATLGQMIKVAAISSLGALLPGIIGWLASIILLVYLINRYTGAMGMDILLIIIVSKIIAIMLTSGIFSLLG